MPHAREACFSCGERYAVHGHAVNKRNGHICRAFEFIPVSSRRDDMIDFTVMFQSESSKKKYEVIAWKYGDYSCRCTGWRNHRTCKHIDQVKASPERYRNQDTQLNASSGSVVGTVQALHDKMAAMEAAVKRGDTVELAKLEAEIEMQSQMFEAAGSGLGEKFQQLKKNIHAHVFEDVQPKVIEKQEAVSITDPDDPFAI